MSPFEEVSAVSAAEPGWFDAQLHPDWSIGERAHGGYLLAILARAATAAAPHDDVLAVSAHYLHSPEAGAVRVHVELLRAGRSASQVHARLEQSGTPCVDALITVGSLDPDCKPYWDAGIPLAEVADRADCVPIRGQSPTGMRLGLMDQVDLRLDPACLGFATGRPTGTGRLAGWLELPGMDRLDACALILAVDAFPPATLDIEVTGWVPTLELTVYLRAVPAPGPVRVLQKAGVIDGGRVDEVCQVWDSTGRLVAHSTQLAGIRLG